MMPKTRATPSPHPKRQPRTRDGKFANAYRYELEAHLSAATDEYSRIDREYIDVTSVAPLISSDEAGEREPAYLYYDLATGRAWLRGGAGDHDALFDRLAEGSVREWEVPATLRADAANCLLDRAAPYLDALSRCDQGITDAATERWVAGEDPIAELVEAEFSGPQHQHLVVLNDEWRGTEPGREAMSRLVRHEADARAQADLVIARLHRTRHVVLVDAEEIVAHLLDQ